MIRIGVDFGGTKIEAAALDGRGRFLARVRRPNPRLYGEALTMVRDLVLAAEAEAAARPGPVGIAMPGSLSPKTGRVRNANSTWLNGQAFREDLERVLRRPVRLANDANCLALSEATDGAAAGRKVVFAMILGTGCGGGLTVDGRVMEGRNGVAGEYGHAPLPWPGAAEVPGPACWCGLNGCLETYISGSGLERDHPSARDRRLSANEIVAAARRGDPEAMRSLERYIDRLARALAVVVNLVDPDAIVLGGGMSNVEELYESVPPLIGPRVFSDVFDTPVLKARHGDSSGVRGAAWLWPLEALA